MASDSTDTPEAAPQPVRKRGLSYRLRGLLGALTMVAFGAPALLSRPWLGAYPIAEAAVLAVGWLFFVGGAWFRFWSILYLGGRKSKVVVNQGPYSIVRNPLYVGSFLLWCSLGLFLGSLTFFLGVIATSMVYAWGTVSEEERYLSAKLGQPYDDYKARVPRFVPRPSLFSTPDPIEVSPSGLWGEVRRASRWTLIPVLAFVLQMVRSLEGWPTPLSLL